MKFYDQTTCVKCRATLGKDVGTCPICGAGQGATASNVQPVVPSRTPNPASSPVRAPYKASPSSNSYYAPPSGAKKNSDFLIIVGGIVAVGAFVCVIVFGRQSASVGVLDKTAPIRTGAISNASQDSPQAHSATNWSRNQESRTPESNRADSAEESSRVIAYCDAVEAAGDRLGKAEDDLRDEIKRTDGDPSLFSDPNWKMDVARKQVGVHDAANALETISDVPAECGDMSRDAQLLANMCDSILNGFTNAVLNQNTQDMQQAAKSIDSLDRQLDVTEKEESRLRARYGR